MPMTQTRRRFLTTLSLAGAAGFLRAPPPLAAEGALETTSVRILKFPGICVAPQYVAEELLRAEGFTDIRYVDAGPSLEFSAKVGRGDVDFTLDFAAQLVSTIDAGGAVTVLGGVHGGCWELFARDDIRTVADLKGKTIGIETARANPRGFLVAMAAHVGLDPKEDIQWVTSTDQSVQPLELFAAGKIDAFLAIPPEPQELRSRHVGHVIFSGIVDRPWSQYFCCMLTGYRQYVRNHPVATKRVLRAILKATDLCAAAPTRVAQSLVDRGFTDRYDYALQTLGEVPYDKWREYDAEDSIRFYALRLHEAGMIKSSPQKIIADGTDWRFLDELKRELKA
jgi:NitT/TauT family transport system substrate-binding protein